MKQKTEFETPFEQTLADFEQAPLPGEWKDQLIGNALSRKEGAKISRFPSFTKIAFGALAACWVAIGYFQVTTPDESDYPPPVFASQSEIAPEDWPVLVQYFSQRTTFNSTL